jgi:EAL domain-containing protein (putative c-di-GMP-specific phosphodiesterase class I)
MTVDDVTSEAAQTLPRGHGGLRFLLGRLKSAPDGAMLYERLLSLHAFLEQHFTHEESPGGFFDFVTLTVPKHKDTVARLRDDHTTMLEMIRQLSLLDPGEGDAFGEGVAELVRHIERHERVERAIMGHALQAQTAPARPAVAVDDAPAPSEADAGLAALMELVSPDKLSVVYQPIVDLTKRTVFAYEALVRCSVPELSSPPTLFEEAVARGCAGQLGRIIRELAVPGADGKRLFMNIHPEELEEAWLVRLDDPIFTHDEEVYLEVTESVPMSHPGLCKSVLGEVTSRAGVHVVIDDLGAGYSNLPRIAELNPRVVKLDRSLVTGIDTSERKLELVAAVGEMCVRLGAKVVAEGVETLGEYHALLTTGVRYAQGYFFARPGAPLPDVHWPD